jgi:hypothetical protein
MTFIGKMCTSGAVALAALIVSNASAVSICVGDLNGDSQVDAADLAILLGAWGTPNADLTGDGTTNGADLAVLLGAWGPCPPPPVCPNPAHNCFVTGTPGCADEDCCNAVCAADPFCCSTQWDSICVGGALDLCGSDSCGTSAGNDCCTTSTVPGCNDEICCNIVCTVDPFCCATAWDSLCVGGAEKLCGLECNEAPACGVPGTGDCCAANGSPFCDDAACCNAVCSFDPFCCDTTWDTVCANLAGDICAPCGGNAACNPNAGDCCVANGTPGCADADCCLLICAVDPFCCSNQWDSICANQAVTNCSGCAAVCPNPDHGCFVTGTPGCSNATCCDAVCAADPFCCETQWDALCVNGANNLCGNAACPNPAHACNVSGTPGCSDETCCNIVCSFDPFCCTTQWDGICVIEAANNCP